MKACEERLNKKSLGIYIQNNDDRSYAERQYRDGWRAAMEYLLSCRGYIIVDWNKEYIDTAVIHKELNDETIDNPTQQP